MSVLKFEPSKKQANRKEFERLTAERNKILQKMKPELERVNDLNIKLENLEKN